jgi:hypothetical protein
MRSYSTPPGVVRMLGKMGELEWMNPVQFLPWILML